MLAVDGSNWNDITILNKPIADHRRQSIVSRKLAGNPFECAYNEYILSTGEHFGTRHRIAALGFKATPCASVGVSMRDVYIARPQFIFSQKNGIRLSAELDLFKS